MSTPVLQTENLNFIAGHDYGENLSTIINVDPVEQGDVDLPVRMNESWGVEWKNVVFNTEYPIMLYYRESVKKFIGISYPYDIKQTLEVWYDTTTGNPSLTHTFYDWNTDYRIGDINITSKLVGYNVDLSRVKKVRYTTYDGVQYYTNHPGNNFTLESYYRLISGFDSYPETSYYLLVPSLNVSPTSLSTLWFGEQKIFTIDSNIAWTITKPSWVTLNVSSGSGNKTIYVTPDKNMSKIKRHGIIYINQNGGELSKTVSIEQAGNPKIVF